MNFIIWIFFIIFILPIASCAPTGTVIMAKNAHLKSSLEEIVKYGNDKSKIASKLPNQIGNMELFKVVDYTKMILIGPDLG